MSETGGELLRPGEGARAIEPLSEQAKQRFAAAAVAQQMMKRDEKKAKKKDDELARVLLELLNDPKLIVIFRPVSALVARNCPSIFLLATISLIHDRAREEVRAYFREDLQIETVEEVVAGVVLPVSSALSADMRDDLLAWITSLQMVIATDPKRIVQSVTTDSGHMDEHLLDVGLFLLQEFFSRRGKTGDALKMKPLVTTLLQHALGPFQKAVEELKKEKAGVEG